MPVLTPAYGRDYKSAKAAKEAYLNGVDFILADAFSPWSGKPCSCRDFPEEVAEIRYRKKTMLVMVHTPSIINPLLEEIIDQDWSDHDPAFHGR